MERDEALWEKHGPGTHVHPWQVHVNGWQNQYSIVKQNKIKIKKIFLIKKAAFEVIIVSLW